MCCVAKWKVTHASRCEQTCAVCDGPRLHPYPFGLSRLSSSSSISEPLASILEAGSQRSRHDKIAKRIVRRGMQHCSGQRSGSINAEQDEQLSPALGSDAVRAQVVRAPSQAAAPSCCPAANPRCCFWRGCCRIEVVAQPPAYERLAAAVRAGGTQPQPGFSHAGGTSAGQALMQRQHRPQHLRWCTTRKWCSSLSGSDCSPPLSCPASEPGAGGAAAARP